MMEKKMSNQNKIGVLAATIIGINAMIGAGVFAMPALLSSVVGPASILSFALNSFIILTIVFSLGRLALLYPGEGWGYRYPSLWGGHLVGMISSCLYIGGVTVAMGFLTQQAGVWLAQYSSYSASTLGTVVLGILLALVLAGTEISSWGQYLIAACVLVPLGITSVICWAHFQPSLVTPFVPHGYQSILTALPVVIFSLLGFESITSLYSVVENPRTNVPRAAVYAVCTVVGMYTLFVSGAFFSIAPQHFSAGASEAFSEVLVRVMPQYGFLKVLCSVGAFFAIFGTLHSMIWSVAVLLFDVVKRVKLTVVTQAVARGSITATTCVVITGAATLYCTLGIAAEKIVAMTPLLIVPAYTLSVVALLLNKKDAKKGDRFLAVLSLASCSLLIYYSLQSVIG